MNLLDDVITYVRRIVKTPSNTSLTNTLIIDYINRFWTQDMDARVQLFDFKTKWQFQTMELISDYNMPVYSIQTSPEIQSISYYPVYQGFTGTSYVNGIQIPMYVQRDAFWKIWPNYIQSLPNAGISNGTIGPYRLTVPFFPAIPGHLDMNGVIAAANGGIVNDPIFGTAIPANIPYSSFYPGVYITYQNLNGSTTTIADSGIFLSGNTSGQLYGLLIEYSNPGGFNPNPFGYSPLSGGYSITSNTVNYEDGIINVTLPSLPVPNTPIQVQSYFFQQGIPRAILQYNNVLTIRPPPDIPYLIEVDAYLTPAAFLATTDAITFAYMSEYIARGAARKILSDTGDWDQFNAYEPLFIEQERLVWKRSQRIFTSQRTGTIYSDLQGSQSNLNSIGQGAT